jgi:hypothetical protein
MAASGVANMAKFFGMSRPVDAGPISSYKPTYVGNIANSNVMDTSTKLTFDVKQELTIDPVATGLGPSDEMAITSIAMRESYLTQFPWSTGDVPETLLWNTRVTPSLLDIATPGASDEYHLTPVAWVAQPFENWRGSLNFRFQIVASAFHKGRLKIVYDPYYNGTSEYNVQYTHVIDLAKERDFTVTVDWGQELSFLDHNDNLVVPFSTSILGGAAHEEANGILAVYVVNDLTTPSAVLSDVSILVSVSAGEDFEVVNPNSGNIARYEMFVPQSGVFEEQAGDLSSADEDLTTQESKPIETTVEHDFAVVNNTADAYKIYFGDPVSSIRQVLKRYCVSKVWAPNFAAGSDGGYFLLQLSNFPQYIGYDPNGNDNSSLPIDPTPYEYGNLTHLGWFTPLFLSRRGGLRVKYVYESDEMPVGAMIVERVTENGSSKLNPLRYATYNPTSPSNLANNAIQGVFQSFSGAHATHLTQNPVLEVELPFASKYRFFPARKKDLRDVGSEFTQQHTLRAPCSPNAGRARVIHYVSAGEDFSLSFFQACPVFWNNPLAPPSATN